MKELEQITDKEFCLETITFKSVKEGDDFGICSVRCDLSNDSTSGDYKVDGVTGQTSGALKLPPDQSVIRLVQLMAGSEGIQAIELKDNEKNIVSSYDP